MTQMMETQVVLPYVTRSSRTTFGLWAPLQTPWLFPAAPGNTTGAAAYSGNIQPQPRCIHTP